MTAFAFTLVFLALVLYALQRNHARQGKPHVAGGADVDDRNRFLALAENFHVKRRHYPIG